MRGGRVIQWKLMTSMMRSRKPVSIGLRDGLASSVRTTCDTCSLADPGAREREPEGQPRVVAVAPEPPQDLLVGLLSPAQLRVGGARPRVEDQPRVAPHQHHD